MGTGGLPDPRASGVQDHGGLPIHSAVPEREAAIQATQGPSKGAGGSTCEVLDTVLCTLCFSVRAGRSITSSWSGSIVKKG